MLAFFQCTQWQHGPQIGSDIVGLSAVFMLLTLGVVMLKNDLSYGELSELVGEFVAYQQLLF
ncbi:hypothetical protein [Pseudoalteromonas ulvae]|uniref:Uncharacterized protein n=1 Tax=Pseudoalteromonas ulvae TaxID=107327 RepID=A0A2C9ZZR8_PSEDV|nr:hypothetical protein [Pseudoalteromonas ulvae]OUL56258.1 hypothetical protein B1199_19295 [Pseudoalteromonas ulvae]